MFSRYSKTILFSLMFFVVSLVIGACSSNVVEESPAETSDPISLKVKGDELFTVFIKKYPNRHSSNISEVKGSNVVKVLGEKRDNEGISWLNVSYEGVKGWVPKDALISKENNPEAKPENVPKEEKKKEGEETKEEEKVKNEVKNEEKEKEPSKTKSKKEKRVSENKQKEERKADVPKKEESKNSNKKKVEKREMEKSNSSKVDLSKAKKISGEYSSITDLNIRSGPGINYEALSYARPGQKLVAQRSYKNGQTTWYEIKRSDGLVGWVGSGYLKKYNPKPQTNTGSSKNGSLSSKGNVGNSSSSPKYKPNHIYYGNKAIPYKNGGKKNGQAIIDGGVYASTWGGAETFSGTDGLNTHFIGHNPGVFSGMHQASRFIITDSKGTPFTYVKTRMYVVNEWGETRDGTSYYDRIVGTGGGERITLQSTKNHPWKYIVEAFPQ